MSEPLHGLYLSHRNIFSETFQTRSSSATVQTYPVLQRQLQHVYQRDKRMFSTSVLTALKTLCFGGDGKENCRSGGPTFSWQTSNNTEKDNGHSQLCAIKRSSPPFVILSRCQTNNNASNRMSLKLCLEPYSHVLYYILL